MYVALRASMCPRPTVGNFNIIMIIDFLVFHRRAEDGLRLSLKVPQRVSKRLQWPTVGGRVTKRSSNCKVSMVLIDDMVAGSVMRHHEEAISHKRCMEEGYAKCPREQ